MKKILVNFLVFVLLLSFVFQSSSASAISVTRVSESEPQDLSDFKVQLDPEVPETPEQPETFEPIFPPEPYLIEHRFQSEDPYIDLLSDPDLPEKVRDHFMKLTEPVEKHEYTPPTPEVVAQTHAQVEAFDCSTVTDVPQSECEALVALYGSTEGAGWYCNTNWLESTIIGSWCGVVVSSGQVSRLSLMHNRLKGPMPAELGNLLQLPELDLSDNYLTGNIPPELGNLTLLTRLVLSNNPLTGGIPSELGKLTNLKELEIMWTQLSGFIPPELGNLTNLQTLTLYDNQLAGNIPPELGNLANLEWFHLGTTLITGNIPPELGELTNLKTLRLESNQLQGSIPPELSNLINLENLLLGGNQLSGFIPPELANMSNLRWLWLGGNQLSGSIPPELGNLNSLEYLNLGGTQLSGSIPPELGNLSNLQDLSLGYTQVSGTIPPELGKLSNLRILYLVYNQLSGSIPPELGNLANLGALRLEHNQLSGSIPPELGNLVNLAQIYLNENQLTGSIPLSFTQIAHLTWFNFSQTSICEPDTPEFLAWKETVEYWTGTGIICEIDDPEGDWLIMYYLVGDNDGYQNVYVLHNYLTGIRNANIDLAIYWDRKYFDTEYLYRFGSGDQTKENFENLDSDDPQTLIDFVNWATSKTNKAHTALVLVDHGNALAGFGWDEGSNSFDYLSHKDLGFVFQNTTPIDVLFMEACTMANLEPVWEFREHVKYYVGHEGITHLFPYSHSYIKNIPASFSASQIAYNIADSHFRFYDSINFASTVSVLDLQRLDELVANLSQLSYSMLTASDTVKDAVWTKMISPDLYRVPISQKKQVVDLLQFVNSIMNIPELNTYANSVVESILDLVRYNGQVSTIFENNENANGVSVALPVEKTSFYSGELFNFASSADWSQTNNTLSQDLSSYDPTINYWGLFVSTYVLDNNPESEDSPEPPPLLPLETLGVLYLPIIITTD